MESLDPKDWAAFGELAHRMVDEMLEHLRTLPDQPAWREMPAGVSTSIQEEPLPRHAQGEQHVYEQFVRDVLPYPNGNLGPRFYGWVQGNGMPLAMMADMLASGMNPHMAGFNQAPKLVEEKVIEWLREAMDFPKGSSGLLMSGGSMASTTGLAIARNARAGYDVRDQGLCGSGQMAVYGSTETHSWARRAVELLGLGRQSLRLIQTNEDLTINVSELRASIRQDRDRGIKPMAVLATAGTVNTGATDDMNAIADLCEEEELWMHVDGAFGALLKLAPNLRGRVNGMERADSLAFDLHKWMYLPFEIACLLVRDGAAHKAAFSQEASYIAALDRGVIKGGLTFGEMGIELTRGFKALKAWMCLKAYGLEQFGRIIEQNVAQAQLLAKMVNQNPSLELVSPVPLNIVCFRFVAEGLSLDELNQTNKKILFLLQERGLAVPSSTVIDGKFCLRACIVNHRTTNEDIEALARDAAAIGDEVLGKG
ncbi:MAG: aspartate aminotransferase family protein [Fimbriimonas sp.]